MGSQNLSLPLALISFFLMISSSLANHNFDVGGKDGWVLKPKESYSHWSSRLRFLINDSLIFKFKEGEDSVLEVNKDDYNNCNTKKPLKSMTSGTSVYQLSHPGPFFFISGKKDHCEKGQKLSVVVLSPRSISPKPKPPSSSPSPKTSPSPSSSSPKTSPSPSSSSPKTSPSPVEPSNPPSTSPSSSPLAPSNPPSTSPSPSSTSPKPSPSSPSFAPSNPPSTSLPPSSTSPTTSPSSPLAPSNPPSSSPSPSSNPPNTSTTGTPPPGSELAPSPSPGAQSSNVISPPPAHSASAVVSASLLGLAIFVGFAVLAVSP